MNAFQARALNAHRRHGWRIIPYYKSVNCMTVLLTHENKPDLILKLSLNPAGKVIGRSEFHRAPVAEANVTPVKPSRHVRQDDPKLTIRQAELAFLSAEVRAGRT